VGVELALLELAGLELAAGVEEPELLLLKRPCKANSQTPANSTTTANAI
jgi:hypothetical protein